MTHVHWSQVPKYFFSLLSTFCIFTLWLSQISFNSYKFDKILASATAWSSYSTTIVFKELTPKLGCFLWPKIIMKEIWFATRSCSWVYLMKMRSFYSIFRPLIGSVLLAVRLRVELVKPMFAVQTHHFSRRSKIPVLHWYKLEWKSCSQQCPCTTAGSRGWQ